MTERLSRKRAGEILRQWKTRVARIAGALEDRFPHIYDPKRGEWITDGGWTEGFWTGILWWLALFTGDGEIEGRARYYTRLLARRKADFSDHDLGFLFDHSCVLENVVTGGEEMTGAALAAAERLSERFNPKGRYIRAHGALSDPERAGYAIIDTIMNLRLLFWAHRASGEGRYYEVARETALTIAREYIRDDGSSWQVVWFDPATGKVDRKGTLQGYGDDSCWSRGQAWGIYGFTQVYRYTGEVQFKEEALRLAGHFLGHLPADGVAFYDFDDPERPAVPRDTSAQAIAAAGLLALAELSVGGERQDVHAQAVRLLSPLTARYVVAAEASHQPRGLLREACHFKARGEGVASEIVYGDYYLTEALMRYLSAAGW